MRLSFPYPFPYNILYLYVLTYMPDLSGQEYVHLISRAAFAYCNKNSAVFSKPRIELFIQMS